MTENSKAKDLELLSAYTDVQKKQVLKNRKYWEKRTVKRLVRVEKMADIKGAIDIYARTQRELLKELDGMYKKGGFLDKLTKTEEKLHISSLEKRLAKLDLSLDDIYSPNQIRIINRLQALHQQVYWILQGLGVDLDKEIGTTLAKVYKEARFQAEKDYSDMGIVRGGFDVVDEKAVQEVLNAKWKGGNYSSRVWDNTTRMAEELPLLIGASLAKGQSYAKTARRIRDQFGVETWQAIRLVRTESNYLFGQAELDANNIFDRYEFSAVLDGRTSEICKRLDGQVFFKKDIKVGLNYPPMHPNCRSTPYWLLPNEARFNRLKPMQKTVTTNSFLKELKVDIEDDKKKRWEQAMKNQFDKTDLKGQFDWNAEMNRAGSLKGVELQNEVARIMKEMPKDYASYDAIKKVATEFYGWKPEETVLYKTAIDQSLVEEAKKYKSAEEFVEAQFNKAPKYGMSHRPTWEGSPPAHNLLDGEMLPRDVYEKPEFSIASGRRKGDKSANESWNVLKRIRNKPDMEVTVYRATRKNELNTGDWVTFSKNYAEDSVEGVAEKVYSFKVKAKDILFAGDDINEFGYYPRSKYEDIWNEVNGWKPEKQTGQVMDVQQKQEVAIQEAVKKMEQVNKDGGRLEAGLVIKDGKVIKEYQAENIDKIVMGDEVFEMQDAVFVHNHPDSNVSFSKEDLDVALRANAKGIIAVAEDYVYTLERTKDRWFDFSGYDHDLTDMSEGKKFGMTQLRRFDRFGFEKLIDKTYREQKELIIKEMYVEVERGDTRDKKDIGGDVISNKVWEEYAKQNGWKYTRKRIDEVKKGLKK